MKPARARVLGLLAAGSWLSIFPAAACELCAIYRAADAASGARFKPGFTFGLAQQAVYNRRVLLDGERLDFPDHDYNDVYTTHFVPGYQWSRRFSINLNVPLVHMRFRRSDLRYSSSAPPDFLTESGTQSGLGDASLAARMVLFERARQRTAFSASFIAGVKLPTGNAARIADEVDQSRIFSQFVVPGTAHDPLSHSAASIHSHSLAFGSGSFDGLFGLTASSRADRWTLNAQLQYYARTKGESDFRFGNMLSASGGPGLQVIQGSKQSLNVQANAIFEAMDRDHLLGQATDRTGSSAVYVGPLAVWTFKPGFSLNIGADLPVKIRNNGLQSVPELRIHGGLSWRL